MLECDKCGLSSSECTCWCEGCGLEHIDCVCMDRIVKCPECKQDELYGSLHWLNGNQYCRSCIQRIWDERERIR